MCLNERCSYFHQRLQSCIKQGFNDEEQVIPQKLETSREKVYDAIGHSGKTLLHYSVDDNTVTVLDSIEKRCRVNAQDNFGMTPLMLAVKTGNLTMGEILLKKSTSVLSSDNDLLSTFQCSFYINIDLRKFNNAKLRRNHQYIFEMFIKRVNELVLNDQETRTKLLFNASDSMKLAFVAVCNIEIASLILQNDYPINFHESYLGLTALHCAIILGKLENVKLLIEHGACIDATDVAGYTPLRYYPNCFQYIDEKSAVLKTFFKLSTTLNIPDKNKVTDVEYLLQKGTKETVKIVLQNNLVGIVTGLDDWCLEYLLMKNIHLNIIDIIGFGIKIDVNSCNSTSMSALMVEVINGNVRNVELLLKYGANVNYSTKNGETPLLYAALLSTSNNMEKITELLLQFGAEAQILFNNGRTLIDYLLQHAQKQKRPIKPILAHLAMLTVIDKSAVKEVTRKSIDAYTYSKDYFGICLQQLEKLKHTFLYGTVTLFKLLHLNEKILVRYAHNPEFITLFETLMNNELCLESYYIKVLHNRVAKAVDRMKLEKKLAKTIEVLTGFHVDVHNIIVLKLISYLGSQDLYYLH